MKLVSAAKLRRAQDAALAGRQFSDEIKKAILLALQNLPEGFTHPYLRTTASPAGAKKRVIVVSGDRGLSGGFNANLLKAAQQEDKANTEYVLVGRKACQSAQRFGWTVAPTITAGNGFDGLPEDVGSWPIDEIVRAATADFGEGKIDEVVVYYTKFISALTQKPTREVLLPLDPESMRSEELSGAAMVAKLEPSAEQVFKYLAPVYIRSKMREAGLESRASEHAARMTAMDAATNNASDLIERLRLYYNRARQSAITRELIDIIGGASAVE